MAPIAYDLVQDKQTPDRDRRRFAAPIGRLTRIGFGEFGDYRETGPAYSALTAFPAALLMLLRREVPALMPPWRLSGASPLLIRTGPPTYAYPFGLGVKLHTRFEEGTAQVTAAFDSQLVPAAPGPLRKPSRRLPIEAVWDWHRVSVEVLVGEGRVIDRNLGFAGFVEVRRVEDQVASRSGCLRPPARLQVRRPKLARSWHSRGEGEGRKSACGSRARALVARPRRG